jgi:WD40 repeat protein
MNTNEPSLGVEDGGIADYEVLKLIDAGAFGQVWLARSKATGRYRAIKIVHRDRLADDLTYEIEFNGLRKFEEISREHEGFVDILHISRHLNPPHFYSVMELADDLETGAEILAETYKPKTLDRELKAKQRLPLEECLQVGLALSAALAELHRHKLAHRDVKPSNVVFIHGQPKLADIGLVTDARTEPPSVLVGTPGYMDSETHGTAQGDLYSLGKVLYVMATGRSATDWPSWPENLTDVSHPDDFLELQRIIGTACHPKRSKRYGSAWEMHADLLNLGSAGATRRLQEMERRMAAAKRYGVLLLLLAGLGFLAVFQWQERRQQKKELRARQVASFVAHGTRAMEESDWLGSLPWFAKALRLDDPHPGSQEIHRLRIASVRDYSPNLVQIWFHNREISFASFTGLENQLLAASPDGRWGILDLATGRPLLPTFGTTNASEEISISSAGSLAVTSCDTNCVRVWDVFQGGEPRALERKALLSHACLSPDGRQAAAASDETNVVVWDLQTRQARTMMAGHIHPILHLVFSPDGRRLVSTGKDGRAVTWDTVAGQPITVFTNHGTWVYWAAFSPDGSRVASAGFDRAVRIWQPETGREIMYPLRHQDGVHSVEFSRDGQSLATACFDFAVRVWDLRDGRLQHLLWHDSRPVYAAFSPQGRHIVTATHDGVIRIWALRDETTAASFLTVAASRDGSRLALLTNQAVAIWDTVNSRFAGSLGPFPKPPLRTLFNRDGSRLLTLVANREETATNTLEAVLWNCETGRRLPDTCFLPAKATNFQLSLKAGRLAYTSSDVPWVWSFERGRFLFEGTQKVTALAFDPRGQRLAFATENSLQILPLEEPAGAAAKSWAVTQAINSIEWNPDGTLIATANWDTSLRAEAARIWSAATGRQVGEALPHRDGILHVEFSRDSSKVVTCGEDFIAVIWETATGRQLVPPLKHKHQVVRAVFSRDGRKVATACKDGSARLWDVLTGEPLTPPFWHPKQVLDVKLVGPDERLLAINEEGTGRIWRLPRDTRPLEDLALIAELLSAQQTRAMEIQYPQSKETLLPIWNYLRGRYPDEFAPGFK